MAQLIRISAETYRALAPAIHNGPLRCNGQAIELSEENSRRVAAAVDELRRSQLDKRCAKIVAEFRQISKHE